MITRTLKVLSFSGRWRGVATTHLSLEDGTVPDKFASEMQITTGNEELIAFFEKAAADGSIVAVTLSSASTPAPA